MFPWKSISQKTTKNLNKDMPNFTLTYNVTILAVKLHPYNEIEDTDDEADTHELQQKFEHTNLMLS